MRKKLSFIRLVLSSLFSFAAALLLGCGGGQPHTSEALITHADNAPTTAGSSNIIASITVLPAHKTVVSGSPVQCIAIAIYTDGTTQDITSQVTWVSSNTNTALISSGGLALTEIPGTAIITAQFGHLSGSTSLSTTFAPIEITSIAVTPDKQGIATGTTQQYTATANFSDGSTEDITATATWTATKSAQATVSAAGLATGVAVGATSIVAQLNGISGSTSLSITTTPDTTSASTDLPLTPTL